MDHKENTNTDFYRLLAKKLDALPEGFPATESGKASSRL